METSIEHELGLIIESLEAKIKEREWISVDERLPEGSHSVLIYSKDGEVGEGYFSRGKWLQYRWSATVKATHWMPKPQPPKQEES